MPNTNEFNDFFRLWEWELDPNGENYSPDWPLFKSPEAERLVKQAAAAMGGLPSVSAFIIAFNKLDAAGTIKQLRQPKAADSEFTLTREEYYKIPAQQVALRYKREPEFRAAVDALVGAGAI